MGTIRLVIPEEPLADAATAKVTRSINTKALRLGLLDNAKGNADHLLAFVIDGMRKLLPVTSVVSLRKNNPSTPAPKQVLDQLTAEADFVVSAMAD